MSWRVRYFRRDSPSPYPISHYRYGDDAEAQARNLAAELTERGVTDVRVERIEKPEKR